MATGIVLLAARSPAGAIVLLAGLAPLACLDRRAFVVAAAVAVTLSTIAWDVRLATVAGDTLDARLVMTFGLAGLALFALGLERPRLAQVELLFLAFLAWIVVVGLLRSDSASTWGPVAARWSAYAGIFVLARACLSRPGQLRALAAAIALGFSVPAALGVIQLVSGEAVTINGAVRATAPGGRGPIALAFAGQMVVLLGYALAASRSRERPAWLATLVLGAGALVATATRLTTLTALAALACVQALQRQWRLIAVAPLVFALVLVIRPDLRERYTGTLADRVEQRAPNVSGSQPSAGEGESSDASSRTRRAIWRTVLREWKEEPIAGIGPGMTAPTYAAVSGRRRVAPHNDYVGVLAELGAIGLALFLALQLAVIRALWVTTRAVRSERERVIPLAVLALFVAVNLPGALNNAVYHLDVQVALWALVGSVLAASSALGEQLVGDGPEALDRR